VPGRGAANSTANAAAAASGARNRFIMTPV
jgi:hypothetical protein